MALLSKMAGALTADEFLVATANFPRLSEKAKKVARAILVDGEGYESARLGQNISRQMAHAWASKIYDVFRPAGWVTELVTLPLEQMEQVREMEIKARAEWEKTLRPPRVIRER